MAGVLEVKMMEMDFLDSPNSPFYVNHSDKLIYIMLFVMVIYMKKYTYFATWFNCICLLTLLIGVQNLKYLPAQRCVFNPNAKTLSKLGDNINYTCTFSYCTSLGDGSLCNGLSATDNTSYAFNMFYQVQNYNPLKHNFQGLAMLSTQNLSQGMCSFIVQIASSSSLVLSSVGIAITAMIGILLP